MLAFLVLAWGIQTIGGCSIFDTTPFKDEIVDENGQTKFADTESNWIDWRTVVDPQLDEEIAGWSAPGFSSWNHKWTSMIRGIEQSQENPERYIQHLKSRRREAGLAEIELQW